MDEDGHPSPLGDIPEEIDDMEPLLEELSNRELENGAEVLNDFVEHVGLLSRFSGENGSFADIIPEDVVHDAKELARFSTRLAEHRARVERLSQQTESVDVDTVPDDLPESVPSKATLTTKEINGNEYYYWQWREGDTIKSEYEAPVNPSN